MLGRKSDTYASNPKLPSATITFGLARTSVTILINAKSSFCQIVFLRIKLRQGNSSYTKLTIPYSLQTIQVHTTLQNKTSSTCLMKGRMLLYESMKNSNCAFVGLVDVSTVLPTPWSPVFTEYQTRDAVPIYYSTHQTSNGSTGSWTYMTRPLQTLSSFQMINETLLMVSLGNIYAGTLGKVDDKKTYGE